MALGLKSGVLAIVMLVLAGCGRFSASPEERINAALPLATETLAARQAFDDWAKRQPDATVAIEPAYLAQLQMRARECGHGYRPSVFSSDSAIRRRLGDRACFERFDHALGQWIGLRHAGLLLAAPPLREVPQQAPVEITADAAIEDAVFASGAGIAALLTGKGCQVMDLVSGQTLHRIAPMGAGGLGAFSSNGRVLTIADGEGMAVLDVETGAVLLRFADTPVHAFFWLGQAGAIHRGTEQARPVFLDFSSGRETVIPMDMSALDQVVPAAGNPSLFALLAPDRVGVVDLQRSNDGWKVVPISETRINEGSHWTRDTSGLSTDGRMFFGAGQYLRLLDMRSMQMRAVAFEPMSLRQAVATADPARIYLTGYFRNAPGAENDLMLYDFRRHRLAPVLRGEFSFKRLLYIPSLRRNGAVDGSRIVLLDGLPAGPEAEPNAYIFLRASVVESGADALSAMSPG